jgi:arsenate reductase-like glutaredoxin family protein
MFACLTLIVQGQQVVLPLHSGSVRFAAFGDMGVGTTTRYVLVRMMNSLHEKSPFDFVMMFGDNIYRNTFTDFSSNFELPYKLLLDHRVKFYASLGNHDNAATEKANNIQQEWSAVLRADKTTKRHRLLCGGLGRRTERGNLRRIRNLMKKEEEV